MDENLSNKLKNLGLPEDIIENIQEAGRFVVDLASGQAVALPSREPCSYVPLAGSVTFPYDPEKHKQHCKDFDLADIYVGMWIDKEYEGEPTAVDLNNVACAYLWLEKPNWMEAKRLFELADEKSQPKNPTITDNKKKVDSATSSRPVIPIKINLTTVKLFQEFLAEAGKKVEILTTKELKDLLNRWTRFE